jgi:hypothetical protein
MRVLVFAKRMLLGFIFLLVSSNSVLQAEAIADPYLGQCVYSVQNPQYYVDDYDEGDEWGTNNTYFNLVWNGIMVYASTPIANVDSLGRPFWETGGYRYTRGALVAYFHYWGAYDYDICKTSAGILAPFSSPRSIFVPPTSTTDKRWVDGAWVEGYKISWGNSINGVTYRLEEATDSDFTTGLRTVVSDTTDRSAAISDRTPGFTYYYRVRAEMNGEFTDWVYGANGCTVSEGSIWSTWWAGEYTDNLWRSDFPTERPLTIRVFYQNGETWDAYIPSSDYYEGHPGTWELWIGGNNFEFYESSQWIFNRIDILHDNPPDLPASISVPTDSRTGSYTVSWTASPTSDATYRLEEATDSHFTTELRTVVSDTTSLSAAISGSAGSTTYYYRVRAEKDGFFSAWVNGANGCTLPKKLKRR